MSKSERKDTQVQRMSDLEILAGLRLMDDDFFSEALDGRKEAVQFILNTVLERSDLEVIQTQTQRSYRSASRHSISLDIWARDKEGRIADIEIQRADKGTGAKRARIHSSMMDRNILEKGQGYDALAETYVILITQNDKYRAGLPVYHIDRMIQELDDQPFGDEAHILYVNGEFQDLNHPIGRLVHDLWCTSADDMLNRVLADEVRYMKETNEGRTYMCEVMEKMREESEARGVALGEMRKLYDLVRKGLLSLSVAAAEAGQSEAGFKAGMDAYSA